MSAKVETSQQEEEYQKRLSRIRVNKRDLDELVMNFLVTEEYGEAAKQFSVETGVLLSLELSTVQHRMQIRQAIQSGHIKKAIQLSNELNPEIVKNNSELSFHLDQQELIELIRNKEFEQAIEYAILHKMEEYDIHELERTMSLTAFPTTNMPEEIKSLMLSEHRYLLGSELNSAILSNESSDIQRLLPELINTLKENQ